MGGVRGIINTLNLAEILDFFHRILKLYCAASTVTSESDTDKTVFIFMKMYTEVYSFLVSLYTIQYRIPKVVRYSWPVGACALILISKFDFTEHVLK